MDRVDGIEAAGQLAGHDVGNARSRAHAEERRNAGLLEVVVQRELLHRAVVQPAEIGVGNPRRERRAHDRHVEVVRDAVQDGVVPLEQPRRRRLVPGVQRRRRDPRIRMRHGLQIRRRDPDLRDELEQVAEHHPGHRAGGAEDRDPHQESSSFWMSGVASSTSFSVSSRALEDLADEPVRNVEGRLDADDLGIRERARDEDAAAEEAGDHLVADLGVHELDAEEQPLAADALDQPVEAHLQRG